MELNVVKIIGSHGDAIAFSSKISPIIEKKYHSISLGAFKIFNFRIESVGFLKLENNEENMQ